MSTGIIAGNAATMNVIQFVWDPGSCAASTTNEQTVTIPGLKVGDQVSVSKPSLNAGISVGSARVSAANTLAVQLANSTASPIDPGSETWTAVVVRPEGSSGPSTGMQA